MQFAQKVLNISLEMDIKSTAKLQLWEKTTKLSQAFVKPKFSAFPLQKTHDGSIFLLD